MSRLYHAFCDLATARDERNAACDDADLRAEVMDERRRYARMNHWCTECHGHTGPGSPCHVPVDDEDEGDNAWFHDADMGDR